MEDDKDPYQGLAAPVLDTQPDLALDTGTAFEGVLVGCSGSLSPSFIVSMSS